MARSTLYFIWQSGCDACKTTKPHVTKFASKHPDIHVEWLDLLEQSEWPEGVWSPTVTPTFVLIRPRQRARTITGERTLAELESWIYG